MAVDLVIQSLHEWLKTSYLTARDEFCSNIVGLPTISAVEGIAEVTTENCGAFLYDLDDIPDADSDPGTNFNYGVLHAHEVTLWKLYEMYPDLPDKLHISSAQGRGHEGPNDAG